MSSVDNFCVNRSSCIFRWLDLCNGIDFWDTIWSDRCWLYCLWPKTAQRNRSVMRCDIVCFPLLSQQRYFDHRDRCCADGCPVFRPGVSGVLHPHVILRSHGDNFKNCFIPYSFFQFDRISINKRVPIPVAPFGIYGRPVFSTST